MTWLVAAASALLAAVAVAGVLRPFRRPASHALEAATDPLRCDPDDFIADVLAQVRTDPQGFDGILQLDDYPSSMLMPLIARELGLPATPVESVFRCEHKLWSRIIQRGKVPEAVPRFQAIPLDHPSPLDGLELPFPLWIKPVKSFMSYLGFRVGSRSELESVVARARFSRPTLSRQARA